MHKALLRFFIPLKFVWRPYLSMSLVSSLTPEPLSQFQLSLSQRILLQRTYIFILLIKV